MIFVDSWVWIEFFAEDEKADRAEEIILSIEDEGCIVTPTVLIEVRYRLNQKLSKAESERVVSDIQNIEGIEILPITTEVGLYAADIREKYYERGGWELSYADSIHVATAAISGCEKLCSGDPDLQEIEEVEVEIVQ